MDYYQTLGVSRTADQVEIRRAFRQKAKLVHPDVNDNPRARAEFQRINEAYQVLQDEEKRKLYDMRLVNGFPAQTVYHRPGPVRYRATGDKYAHYRSKSAAEKNYEKFEKAIDFSLFLFVFVLGLFGFSNGLYRLLIKPEKHIDPYPGIIMGVIFLGVLALLWFKKRKLNKN